MSTLTGTEATPETKAPPEIRSEGNKFKLSLKINGESREVYCHPMARLLDVIREDFRLTGTKEGCGEGECGACGIFLNGELVNSCLIPALQAQHANLETIESVGNPKLTKLQESFWKNGGAQCGICTPGMILASINIQRKKPNATLEDIKEGLAGNLCRCTGYMRIFKSITDAMDIKMDINMEINTEINIDPIIDINTEMDSNP